MKFKEFKNWCNNRATDGCWSLAQAKYCIDLIELIQAYPFWKREKVWKKYEEKFEKIYNLTVLKGDSNE